MGVREHASSGKIFQLKSSEMARNEFKTVNADVNF